MESAPGNLFSWNSRTGRRSRRTSFAPESRRRFTRAAGMVSMLSSTPWPASRTAENVRISQDRRRETVGRASVLLPFVIFDGDVLVVRCPGHDSFSPRCIAHYPYTSAGIERAGYPYTA